ncbi:tetratricopeptide repeat protein 27 [Episyrphus balteatus]|uniref:tetratricopeptide repeat protein 27 n=1 Tax=Episyrphus balteatus TaxID=286459 RepID=UPI002485A3FB|nr:tetratricopeptide repeat protein 27 [Episyrphus balteatus]
MLKDDFSPLYLCNFNDNSTENDFPKTELKELWSCKWDFQKFEKILQNFLKSNDNTEDDVHEEFLSSISLILAFVQNNFTGSFENLEKFKEITKKTFPNDFEAVKKLMVNGEEINPNVQIPEFLYIAEELLKNVLEKCPNSVIANWWKLRVICVHQNILDDLTSDLYEDLKKTCEFLLTQVKTLNDIELESLLYLEIAYGYLLFHRTQKCEEVLNTLCSMLEVELNVEGLLGLRTKFQQKALPQLCLKVKQNKELKVPTSSTSNGSTNLPKLLKLDDDTRLEKIRFLNVEDNNVMSLPSILQAVVLAKVKHVKRSQPTDRLAEEEIEPYINTLLYQDHGPLAVRLATLLLNISQECKQNRTVERSLKQCEEVVNVINGSAFTLPQRLSYGFASFILPKWEVQKQLGELMVSLGMTKSALDLYLQIQAWEEVIKCYTKLDLRHKAAEIVRQELEKKPTVLLYCLLGDATDDVKCYETAWEFSKHTSAKAQAHWGSYFFARKEYDKALPHFEKSVEINSLQERIWLRLGYSAISLEKWEIAVHAYITYTHLEPLGYESWNNLAKALIKLGDKKRAHRVLGESLKCNYQNWKVWENFMLVSVDTGNFEDAINSYNRLSELKDRFLDLEVLSIVITAISKDTPDAQGRSTQRLVKKANTLLGHQCVKHGAEARLWELSALLAATPLNKAQKLQRAYRAYTQKELAWASKQPSSMKVLQLCKDLSEYSLEAVNNHEDSEKTSVNSQLSSARLSAQACIRAVEKDMEKWDENEKVLAELKELLEKLTETLKERMK